MTTTAQSLTINARHSRFDGRLLTPGDPGYDSARSVWNGMIDRRPTLIARCASVADVVTAVRTARERDLEIGVRCGGHNIAGFAVPDWARSPATPNDIPTTNAPTPSTLARVPFFMNRAS